MKRIFLAVVILIVTGTVIFAQQAAPLDAPNRPSSAQTKENARAYLNQARSNSSQFDSSQSELNDRNTSNNDTYTFNKLKSEIDRLETAITSEQNKMASSLDKGIKVKQSSFDRIQELIDQHKAKVAELEAFTSR